MKKNDSKYYLINGITMYRLVSAPFLLFLIFYDSIFWFKWLLALSFFTDAIDGYLARKYKVASLFGTRLDSVADDFTVLVAIIGLYFFKHEFIREKFDVIIILLSLFVVQNTAAFIRYRKTTSFHTYLAKSAAIFQAVFFMMIYFEITALVEVTFYLAMLITFLELAEETIMVFMLPEWKANVKGLYWVMKEKFKV